MIEDLILTPGFNLRTLNENDDAFLFSLFCSSRTELTSLPLPPEQLELLLRQQYKFQQTGYATQYPQALALIIEYQSLPIGKIILNKTDKSVHVVDIAITPQSRGQGYGSMILQALKNYAQARDLGVSLGVDPQNIKARQLYLRLGFNIYESSETHAWLRWP